MLLTKLSWFKEVFYSPPLNVSMDDGPYLSSIFSMKIIKIIGQ